MNKSPQKNCNRPLWVGLLLLTLWLNPLFARELPQAVSEEMVSGCAFIALVEGSSGLKKLSNWQEIAKEAALFQAAKLNASHVVLDSIMPVSSGNGIVTGKAYHCEN